MKNLIVRKTLFVSLISVVAVALAGVAWAAGPATGPQMKVVYLGNGMHQDVGQLRFMGDKLVFNSSDKSGEEVTLQYGNLKKVEFKSARLLKFETENGDKAEFSSYGAAHFDSNTVAFLKNHLEDSVNFESHIR